MPQSDHLDEVLSALADRNRRTVLNYLRESPTGTASVDELARAVDERGPDGADESQLVLHHSVIPRLEAVGAVEYDADRRVARYPGHASIESLLEAIRDLDAGED